MHSLSCGQHKLLLKTEPDMEIAQTNNFMYNAAFTAPNTKLKINVLQQEQSGEERRSTETKVLIDRQHQVTKTASAASSLTVMHKNILDRSKLQLFA